MPEEKVDNANIAFAVLKLQRALELKSKQSRAAYVGMALNYLALEVRGLGCAITARKLMELGAGLVERGG